MKNILAAAEAVIDITDRAEVSKELNKFGEWIENLIPKLLDSILEIALAFVFLVIGIKLVGWVRKILKKSLEKNNADMEKL